jgi:pimeloyl-ACP methyl ester carboxylesterase
VAVDNTKKLVVVSFRGSVSVRNWLTNFDIPLVPTDICSGCLVHQGWWSAWFEARATVLAAIIGTCDKYPDYQLVLTGHSAGGAIATLAAAELRKMGYTAALVSRIILSGGPY